MPPDSEHSYRLSRSRKPTDAATRCFHHEQQQRVPVLYIKYILQRFLCFGVLGDSGRKMVEKEGGGLAPEKKFDSDVKLYGSPVKGTRSAQRPNSIDSPEKYLFTS